MTTCATTTGQQCLFCLNAQGCLENSHSESKSAAPRPLEIQSIYNAFNPGNSCLCITYSQKPHPQFHCTNEVFWP